jgi:hypothetical protein
MVVVTAARATAASVIALRIAYGVALIVAPQRLEDAPVQVALRALGARETVLHTGALLAATRGGPLRPWLAASAAGDLTDVVATAMGRRRLPPASTPATVAVGGGAALTSIALAAVVDR